MLALLLLQRWVQEFSCSERMLWLLLLLRVSCAGVDVISDRLAAAWILAVRATCCWLKCAAGRTLLSHTLAGVTEATLQHANPVHVFLRLQLPSIV